MKRGMREIFSKRDGDCFAEFHMVINKTKL